jgi:PST family polysaccharide transporter
MGAVAKIVLILLKAPLVSFAWVVASEATIVALGLVIAYHANGYHIKDWRSSLDMALKLLGQSWVLILSGIGVVIYLRVDQLMIRELMGSVELGKYSAAIQLSVFWYFIPAFIAESVFPSMIRSREINNEIYRRRLQKIFDLLSWLGLLVAGIGIIFSDSVIAFMFGKDYEGAGTILSIHIWAGIFVSFGHILSKWLINEGHLHFSPIRHGLGALINITLNWLLIPIYGGIGAAFASVVSYAVAAYLSCFLYPHTRNVGKLMSLALVVPLRTIWHRWQAWK